MSNFGSCVLILIVAAGLLGGCSSDKDSRDQTAQAAVEEPMETPTADPPQEPEEPAEPADPPEPAEAQEPAEPDEPAESIEPLEPEQPIEPDEPSEPAEPSTPAEPDEPTEPAESEENHSPTVEVPSGPVRVEPAKEGLTDVGVDRCAKCHKIQYASWLETEHAKLTPPLDCEACHGPGSEYRSLKIMKDPEASRASGLVDPSPAFCASCHVSGWEDELLQRSHAHKTSGDE